MKFMGSTQRPFPQLFQFRPYKSDNLKLKYQTITFIYSTRCMTNVSTEPSPPLTSMSSILLSVRDLTTHESDSSPRGATSPKSKTNSNSLDEDMPTDHIPSVVFSSITAWKTPSSAKLKI